MPFGRGAMDSFEYRILNWSTFQEIILENDRLNVGHFRESFENCKSKNLNYKKKITMEFRKKCSVYLFGPSIVKSVLI